MLVNNSKIAEWERKQMEKASNQYHYNFDSKLYNAATKGKSAAYCNRLIDQAMALCGYPGFKFDRYARLSSQAVAFLERFVESEPEASTQHSDEPFLLGNFEVFLAERKELEQDCRDEQVQARRPF